MSIEWKANISIAVKGRLATSITFNLIARNMEEIITQVKQQGYVSFEDATQIVEYIPYFFTAGANIYKVSLGDFVELLKNKQIKPSILRTWQYDC